MGPTFKNSAQTLVNRAMGGEPRWSFLLPWERRRPRRPGAIESVMMKKLEIAPGRRERRRSQDLLLPLAGRLPAWMPKCQVHFGDSWNRNLPWDRRGALGMDAKEPSEIRRSLESQSPLHLGLPLSGAALSPKKRRNSWGAVTCGVTSFAAEYGVYLWPDSGSSWWFIRAQDRLHLNHQSR